MLLLIVPAVSGQIDPEKRHLIQVGYDQPLKGHGPLPGYAFYYANAPNFPHTNMTLRVVLAPVYLDSELGFHGVISEYTDVAVGLAGGGFADSYYEVHRGRFVREESFTGHGGEISGSLYHLFNSGHLIPLNAILRGSIRQSIYTRDSKTHPAFVLPDDRASFNVRAGLRWGGREPVIFPALGMELSTWYEGQFTADSGGYGFGDRRIESNSHLFWGRALAIYTFPEWQHRVGVNLSAGTSIRPDRFSVYRLGGFLPLASEFPLTLPGYFYEEISARGFVLFSGNYTVPIDPDLRWRLTAMGAIGRVDYLPGLEQPGRLHSGVGAALGYKSPQGVWDVSVGYSYGFDAMRNGGRGGHSIGILCQIDLDARARERDPLLDIESPHRSRGLFRLFGL